MTQQVSTIAKVLSVVLVLVIAIVIAIRQHPDFKDRLEGAITSTASLSTSTSSICTAE